MKTVKISVIIAIYNIEQYVSRCIESVIHQTYLPYEVLLVNDGSKDRSLNICEAYVKQFPDMIKVIDKQNGGLSSARNAGLKNSGGEYVYFVDGDDYILPKTLESFVELLEESGEVDFLYGRMSYFTDDDRQLREQPLFIDNDWNHGTASGQRLFADAFIYQGALAMGVRGLYNREFLLKNELFFVERRCSWPEDEQWTPRVFLCAKKAAGNQNADYCYREGRTGSESTKLLNLQTGLITADIYRDWVTMGTSTSGLEADFSKYLLREAGRRFVWLVSGYSKNLSEEDLDQFLSYASNYRSLAKHTNKLSPKCVLLKWLILLTGVKNAGRIVRMSETLRKRRA